MNELITVSSKGQITIPIHIREELNLEFGEKLFCSLELDRIIIKKPQKNLLDYEGFLSNALPIEEAFASAKHGLSLHVLEGGE